MDTLKCLYYVAAILILGMAGMCQAGQSISIHYDQNNAMHVFGAQDLKEALKSAGHPVVDKNADLQIVLSEFKPGMGPQSFRIQKEADRGESGKAGQDEIRKRFS